MVSNKNTTKSYNWSRLFWLKQVDGSHRPTYTIFDSATIGSIWGNRAKQGVSEGIVVNIATPTQM